MKCDFSGWVTRNNLKCSDGRTIRKDAFKDNDGDTVPLVWNHKHDGPFNVIGHADLENREDGVYAYCTFNDTDAGKNAKLLVEHGDVRALSIWANQLKQIGGDVFHGAIREVSLVLAGANPGAFIDNVIKHGVECDDEGIIYTNERLVLCHSDETEKSDDETSKEKPEDKETIEDVFNTLTDKQKNVVYAMIGQALEHNETDDGNDSNSNNSKEDNIVKHNIFDQESSNSNNTLSHSDMMAIINDAKRYGSMRDSAIAHGIDDIEYLFPEAKTINNVPEFIQRETGWVQKVIGSVHHTPFSRIKSIFADITEDDARAKGYIKGKMKKEEVFGLLKRTTVPTTVYKKQKLDRDDVLDITDFDVVAWLKSEMRMMLDEEIARAILIGDGRLSSSDDKINEQNIRPIVSDDDLYTIKSFVNVAAKAPESDKADAFITAAIKSRKDYKGSGSPSLYTTEDTLTSCLLLKDANGRFIYTSTEELSKVLRVKEIVTVPVMENATGKEGGELLGIIVNLADYNVGADKGGAVNMFDDFDIDYNAQKYLIETRCSGALIKPYSAIALEVKTGGNASATTNG